MDATALRGALHALAIRCAEPEARIGSLRHPNGFSRVRISSRPGQTTWVHLWRRADTGASDAHSHRWSFQSTVLRGAISHTLFRPYRSRCGTHLEYRHRLASDLPGTRPEWSLVGRANLEQIDRFELTAGVRYVVGRDDLHIAEPLSSSALTLVEHGPRQSDVTSVFSLSRKETLLSDPPPGLGKSLFKDLVQEMLEVLNEMD